MKHCNLFLSLSSKSNRPTFYQCDRKCGFLIKLSKVVSCIEGCILYWVNWLLFCFLHARQQGRFSHSHSSGLIKAAMMKVSLLVMSVLVVILFLHTLHYSEASEISQVLDREIRELRDAIEKRRKRKPCGFTWNLRKCKSRGKRSYRDKRVR